MAHLSQLLSRLPSNIDVRMSTMGHVVWVSWHDKLAPAVGQTLLNYGGMLVGEEEGGLSGFSLPTMFSATGPPDGMGQF